MKTVKDNIFNIIISTLLAAILATMWSMYSDWQQLPDKWEDNKVQHDRYDELIQEQREKITELQIQVRVLELKDK